MADATYQPKVYRKQGGAEFVVASSGQVTVESGGEIEVESGGVLDIETGGALKIAGTQITPTAAQFNYLSGVTAGTAAANKAAVLGANRNIDRITLPVSGLRIGSSDGTAVAATAAELNTLNTVTAGTAKASKAAVLGANRNLDRLTLPASGLRIGTSSGTAVAATAAELNTLNTVVAGTAKASKAVVLGANRNLDRLTLSTGGLRIGSSDGTAVTANAAELNFLDGASTGTATAGKAVVLGAMRNLDRLTLPASGLRIGTSSGTAVAATAAELNVLNGVTGGTAAASKAAVLGANRNLDRLTLPAGGLRIGMSSGTAVTADAAELNVLDAVTAGTAAASKAAVLGANRNLDRLTLAVGGLRIGTSSGTAVTPTAAELNVLDGAPMAAAFVVGAESSDIINVGIQLNDAAGAAVAAVGHVDAWLSDSSGGGVLSSAPNAVAIGTDGLAIPLVVGRCFKLISEDDGDIDLNITESSGVARTMYLALGLPSGKLAVSAAITFAT